MSPDLSAALQTFQLRSVSEAVGPLPDDSVRHFGAGCVLRQREAGGGGG
jgi:hypothetical protein